MEKVKLIMMGLFTLAMTSVGYSQITTTTVSDSKEILDETPYDSLSNFLGKDCHKYVGQEFYLLPKNERLREYGYEGFTLDYTKGIIANKSNIYKYDSYSFNSKYDDLSGKYFEVLEIFNHPKAKESEYLYGKKKYLKLKEKESGDIVYYLYDSNYEHSFPFLVVGYFLKQKGINIGKQFIVRGDNWISPEPMSDMKTGLPISFDKGSKWTCIDLSLEDKYYTLIMILENEKGEQIPLSLSSFQRFHIYWRNLIEAN